MNINIYKLTLFIIDIALAVSGVLVFFSLKKYYIKHKNETVEENEEQLKSYIYKFTAIGISISVLGIIAIVVGILGRLNS